MLFKKDEKSKMKLTTISPNIEGEAIVDYIKQQGVKFIYKDDGCKAIGGTDTSTINSISVKDYLLISEGDYDFSFNLKLNLQEFIHIGREEGVIRNNDLNNSAIVVFDQGTYDRSSTAKMILHSRLKEAEAKAQEKLDKERADSWASRSCSHIVKVLQERNTGENTSIKVGKNVYLINNDVLKDRLLVNPNGVPSWRNVLAVLDTNPSLWNRVVYSTICRLLGVEPVE